MPCADGTLLATRVWTPESADGAGSGPWPVLLMRQPYGRAIASTVTYAHPRWYAERGFVVAVQDVRGRGDSSGTFRGFAGEAADGAAAVRWARRLDQGNGRVGTYGFSYQGLSQLLIEGTADDDAEDGGHDPLPDCLVPAMAGLDERLHWASEGGAHWWAPGLAWALQLAAEGCRRRGEGEAWRAIRRSLTSGAYLEEGPALLERHDPEGMGLAWLRLDPASAAGWRTHPVEPQLLRRPMLLVGGWHDPQLRGVLDLWRRVRTTGGRAGLVIGPWTHLDWQGGVDSLQLAFFRRHLQPPDIGNGPQINSQPDPLPAPWQAALEGGVALAAEPAGGWFQPEVAVLEAPLPPGWWGLASDGRATVRSDGGLLHTLGGQRSAVTTDQAPPRGGDRVALVHDPWRPLPARGGHLGQPAGPVDRRDIDQRTDVACFTTAPWGHSALLVGRPQLRLPVAADQPGFDLCVALSMLAAGRPEVLQLSTGFARFRGPAALRMEERTVALQPVAIHLAPGDRLRLAIGAAAWPAIAVNPGDGSLPWGNAGMNHRVISLVLELLDARLELLPLLADGEPDGRAGANCGAR